MNRNKKPSTRTEEGKKRKEKLDKWARARDKAKSNVSEYRT